MAALTHLPLRFTLLHAIALTAACNFPKPADVVGEAGPSDASLPGEAAADGPPIDSPVDSAPDAPDPPGTVLHVSPTGDDANDGLTMPVKTLKHAIGLAATNSTIRTIVLASGRYSTVGGETFPYTVPANVSIVGPAGGGAILAGTKAELGMTVGTGELKDLEFEDFTVAIATMGMAHIANIHVRTSTTAVRAETSAKLTVDNLDITGTAGACSAGLLLNGGATLAATTLATRNLGTALEVKDHSLADITNANLSGDRTCNQAMVTITTDQTFTLNDSSLDDGNDVINILPDTSTASLQVTITNSAIRGAKRFGLIGGCGLCSSLRVKMIGGEISGNGQGGAEMAGGSWIFNNVLVRENVGFGLDCEGATLVMRNCTVKNNNGDGVSLVSPIAVDLGTIADPGNSLIQGNSLELDYSPGTIQVEAVGNTWNPSVQESDMSGRYVPDFVQGPIPFVRGNNYLLSCAPGQCTLHR